MTDDLDDPFGYCSFRNQDWQFWYAYDAPVLVCDTHGERAEGAVYDCDVGREIGLCVPTRAYVIEHTGCYGEDRIGREVVVDESRCRCGRPVERCDGRKNIARILVRLAEQQAADARNNAERHT